MDMVVLGLNSGTAEDGMDCAICRFKQQSPSSPLELKILQYDELPVPENLLRMLREAATTPSAMAQINIQLGEMFGQAILDFCEEHNIDINMLDLMGSHGPAI